MKAIITVVGPDRVGIIGGICSKLTDWNVNVLDLSQTILVGNFTMMMAVDLERASLDFPSLSEALNELGAEMGMSIRIQREEIFDAISEI